MTTTRTRDPEVALREPGQVPRLTRWSLLMVPAFIVIYFVTSLIGLYLIFPILDLHEGDLLLFARDVAGWMAAIVTWLLLAAAPITGVVLAVKAVRRGGRLSAWFGLVLNAALTLLVSYMVFDEIRMTYFPQMSFPFGH